MTRLFFNCYNVQIGHRFWRLHERTGIIVGRHIVYYLFYQWLRRQTSLRLPAGRPSLILISHVYRTFFTNHAVLKILLSRETLVVLFRILDGILLQNDIWRVNPEADVQRREFLLRANHFHERWQFFNFIISDVLDLGLLQSLDLHNLLSQFDPQPVIQLYHFFVFDRGILQFCLQLINQILIHILFDYFLDEQVHLIIPLYLLQCLDDLFHRVQLTSRFTLQFELLNDRHNILHKPCISLPFLFILCQIRLNN